MSAAAARRSPVLLIVLSLAIAIAAVGTVLWITGIARPAPAIPPAPVIATLRQRGVLTLTLAAGDAIPIDRAAETIRRTALAIASGRATAPGLLVFDVRSAARPLMRLAYDPGVLAAGAVAGATAGHMLDLAGAGSAPPRRDDPALAAYCHRLETGTKPFCTQALSTAGP